MRFWVAVLLLVPIALARANQDSPESFYRDSLKLLNDWKLVLAGVKDKKTAEAARPQLIDFFKRWVGVGKKLKALQKDAEQSKRLRELGKKHDKEMKSLTLEIAAQVKRIDGLPEARAALKDVMFRDGGGAVGDAQTKRAVAALQTLTTVVEAYHSEHGQYPESLKVLTEKQGKGQPLLERKALMDPWGRPYLYEPSMTDPLTGRPLIYSLGPSPYNPFGLIRNWNAPPKK